MHNKTLFDYVQLAMSVAVFAGLVLVVIELRQAHSIAQQQAAATTYSDLITTQQTYLGENFSTTLAKACRNVGELTDAELLQMRAYRNIQLITITRLRLNQEIAGFSYDWQEGADGPLARWLYTPVAHAQLANLDDVDPSIKVLAKQYIAHNPNSFERCAEELSLTRQAIHMAQEKS